MSRLTETLKFLFSAKPLVKLGAGIFFPALGLSTALFALPPNSTGAVSAPAVADRLVIRLINAETGRPMSHQNVQIEWDDDAEESIVFIGGQGRGTIPLLSDRDNLTMKPGVKDWGDPNRLAFFSCSGPTIAVPVQQARRAGFVAHNECNDKTAQAKPGEIVFWARPLPLWVPDFQ